MKGKIIKALFFTIVLIAGICLAGIKISQAQISITIYPLSFKLTLNPGDVYESAITVVNPNDFDLGVLPEKENMAGAAEGSVQLLGEMGNAFGLASWISYNEKETVLKPQERREFPFKISIPNNAQPGGHYVALLFRAVLPEEAENKPKSGVGISGRVGTLVLVEVTGDVKKSGEITSIEAPKFISHGPLEAVFKVKNTGNSHFSPEGKMIFSGLFGLWKKEVSWESRIVFPGFDRTFKVQLGNKYLFGPIKATVNAKISDDIILPAISITTWAFPWQEAAVLIVIIGLLILAVKIFKKKFKIVKIESRKEPEA